MMIVMLGSIEDQIVFQKLTPDKVDALLVKLISLLPYPIPLARRIQFHHRHPSVSAHIYLAFHDRHQAPKIQAPDGEEKTAWLIPPQSTWLAAYIDLARPGQTQCWLFASWELPQARRDDGVEHALVLSLLKYIYQNLVPTQPLEPTESWLFLRDTGKYLSQPYDRNKVLFGSIHSKVWKHFPEHAIKRIDSTYGKYIFDASPQPGQEVKLPDGYTFGNMTEDLLKTVLDRSPIPRTLLSLKSLLNRGLFYQGHAIGWGFVGSEGSISSLHTEPEHRGKGLAVAVGKELVSRQSEAFGHEGMQYSHADVSRNNAASNSVMKKMGGTVRWEVAWVTVNLSEALGKVSQRREV